MTTRFTLPASTDWKALRATIVERARLYEGMAGLVSKAFVVDEVSREYGGNYVWESREAAEAFVASETFRGAVAKFGTPDVRIHEVVAYVEGAAAPPRLRRPRARSTHEKKKGRKPLGLRPR